MIDVLGALEVVVDYLEVSEAVANGYDMGHADTLCVLDGKKLLELVLVY